MRRVKFYSRYDGATFDNLQTTEVVLNSFNKNKTIEINNVIEYYNIIQYFNNDLYLKSWTNEQLRQYKELIPELWEIIKKYFRAIDNDNLVTIFKKLYFDYTKDFWFLFNKYQCFNNVDTTKFETILNYKKIYLSEIIQNKETVAYYSNILLKYFIDNPITLEIILSNFEQEFSDTKNKIFLPKGFSLELKEKFVNDYILLEEPNLNFLNLIVNSQHPDLKISEEIKFKALKKSELLSNKIFKNGNATSFGVQLSIANDQKEPVINSYNKESNTIEYSYDKSYLDETLDFKSIFYNFNNLFGFLDNQGCISMVRRQSEIDVFENTFMRSKNEYLLYTMFVKKNMRSNMQMKLYRKYLESNSIEIEDVLEYIIKDYFSENYGLKNIHFSPPSKSTKYFEKIRVLAPEIESILKQYKAYLDTGTIDFELLSFVKAPLFFSKIKSKLEIKYVYGVGDDFIRISNLMFSDQASIAYTEVYKSKYKNFKNLLVNEDVTVDSFHDYKKYALDFLLEKEIISVDVDGYLRINKLTTVVYEYLYYREVINFWHFPNFIREEILRLKVQNIVEFDNSLFTKEELSYLNYNLNSKEFSNGLNLRNKYAHGSNYIGEEKQETDYEIILKILILVLLKINDDLKLTKLYF